MQDVVHLPHNLKASVLIEEKIKENGGTVIVHTLTGKPCKIFGKKGGKFTSDKLAMDYLYRYEVFDVISQLLLSNHGKALKGNGRNYKLGEAECNENTVVGAIGKYYFKRSNGDSVYDPVFLLAAIMEWAGIIKNERGKISFSPTYRAKLFEHGIVIS